MLLHIPQAVFLAYAAADPSRTQVWVLSDPHKKEPVGHCGTAPLPLFAGGVNAFQ